MPAKILRFVSRGMQNYIKWKMSCYTPEQLKAAAERGRELMERVERERQEREQAVPTALPRAWHHRPSEGDDQT
jgi:hypothetical protein